MLKNYLTITLRNLAKQKGYAFINIFGLAVGIAFCALIFLYVQDEWTFDRFHEKANRIYRITQQEFTTEGIDEQQWAWQPMPLATALESDIPEVEATVRLMGQDLFLRYGERTAEESIVFGDPTLFDLFSFPMLQGDVATALNDPNSIVLSATAARKYFGDADPMGQPMEVRLGDAFVSVIVTGVARDVPGNASVRFDYLMPFEKLPEAFEWIANRRDNWRASSFYIYALLREGATKQAVEAKLPALHAQYNAERVEQWRADGRWTGEGPPPVFQLQPLTDIHLDPTVRGGLTSPSDPAYSYILAGIALAILLIACINFTTLAIGRSAGRAREIGIRKVVGARRRQLMAQFWGEAVLMSLLALGAGVALAELFLPTFNALAAKDLQFAYLQNGSTALMLFSLVLVVGLVAGCYPALVLSGLRPVETLKQRLRLGGSHTLSKALVVVQFALSVFLIIGTLVMLRQIDYLQTKNLGYNQNHVVVIPTNDLPGDVLLPRFRESLAGRPEVTSITGTSTAFTKGWSREGWDYKGEKKSVYTYRIDAAFLEVMQTELVAGRNLDTSYPSDSTQAVLVNEALVRDFGWEEPIGQVLEGFYASPTVVGVVKDLNFLSLHQDVEPMVLTLDPGWGLGYLLARIAPDRVPEALDLLETTWATVAPGTPYTYSFLDDDLAQQYESEQRWSRMVGYGAGFAVLIACLGLFGLAALSVTGRTKEIGIRKVLGASIASIALLLSKDFARLVLIGIALAAPIAYLVMQGWLDDFAYRIDLSVSLFALAGVLALTVALLTVSYQAIRAALADPVKSLRYE